MTEPTMLAIQALGIIGAALDIYATLHKSDKHLIRIHSVACIIFALHFFLLGAISGAVTELLNGTRTGLASFTKSKILAYAFLTIYTALLLIIPQTPIETLPFIAALLITTGLFFFQSIKMRLFYIAGFSLWVIYSIAVQSLGGIIVFTMLITTSTITITRLYKDQT